MMSTALKLIDAITKLLAVLVWPAVLVFIILRFGTNIREFIANLGEFSLKGAGFEASAKRQQVEAAAALGAAVASHSDSGVASENLAVEARTAGRVVADVVTPQIIRQARSARVLWVDDRPNNNLHERQALEALGVSFELASSTEEALQKLEHQSFDAIISDMGRPPDPRAGYTLLDRIRSSGDRTPFIIYAGSRAPQHQTEAKKMGALGCTNRPDELFKMVLEALGREQ